DQVTGLIYDIKDDMGAFVAVEGKYYGLILTNELLPNMKIGQKIEGRITKVREDGKLNLTTAQRIDFQMDSDSERLYQRLCDADGFLPYHDKTDKDVINKAFNMSKGAFKRALGRLYKEEKIVIKEDGIYKI
ncbi:MAG: RNA-binding protein, partial [Firmicutes bacterium HGW-Firmicutes-3]